MDLNERNKTIDKCRGEFIGRMAFIEIILGNVLSVYLMPMRLKYGSFIFSTLSMPIKVTILSQAIQDNKIFSEYSYLKFIKRKNKLVCVEGLPKDINEMQTIRNHFAHSLSEIPFYGYQDHIPIIATKISFRNGKNMQKDFFKNEAAFYELEKHEDNMVKLDKIKNALMNIMHFYNKTELTTTQDEKDQE